MENKMRPDITESDYKIIIWALNYYKEIIERAGKVGRREMINASIGDVNTLLGHLAWTWKTQVSNKTKD